MVLTAFALLLLSAEPDPTFAVVTTTTPELSRVANSAGATLAERLELTHVELGGYLKTMGSRCDLDTRCLLAAPGLSTATRLLHLRVRPVSGGRLAAELRFIDRSRMLLVDRSAAIVEPGELATWAEQAATRIFTRANAPTRTLPPSPFPGRKPAPTQSAPTPPPSVPRPAPQAPPPPPTRPDQGVRGPDDEP